MERKEKKKTSNQAENNDILLSKYKLVSNLLTKIAILIVLPTFKQSHEYKTKSEEFTLENFQQSITLTYLLHTITLLHPLKQPLFNSNDWRLGKTVQLSSKTWYSYIQPFILSHVKNDQSNMWFLSLLQHSPETL